MTSIDIRTRLQHRHKQKPLSVPPVAITALTSVICSTGYIALVKPNPTVPSRVQRISPATPTAPTKPSAPAIKPANVLYIGTYGGVTIAYPVPKTYAKPLALADGQRFGAYRTSTRLHVGVDFAVPIGTPVLALESGKVVKVGDNDTALGYNVTLRGVSGVEYVYGHLDKVLVKEGASVTVGTVLAHSGNTQGSGGLSTGPHLHLEVYPGATGSPIDPLIRLNQLTKL